MHRGAAIHAAPLVFSRLAGYTSDRLCCLAVLHLPILVPTDDQMLCRPAFTVPSGFSACARHGLRRHRPRCSARHEPTGRLARLSARTREQLMCLPRLVLGSRGPSIRAGNSTTHKARLRLAYDPAVMPSSCTATRSGLSVSLAKSTTCR